MRPWHTSMCATVMAISVVDKCSCIIFYVGQCTWVCRCQQSKYGSVSEPTRLKTVLHRSLNMHLPRVQCLLVVLSAHLYSGRLCMTFKLVIKKDSHAVTGLHRADAYRLFLPPPCWLLHQGHLRGEKTTHVKLSSIFIRKERSRFVWNWG